MDAGRLVCDQLPLKELNNLPTTTVLWREVVAILARTSPEHGSQVEGIISILKNTLRRSQEGGSSTLDISAIMAPLLYQLRQCSFTIAKAKLCTASADHVFHSGTSEQVSMLKILTSKERAAGLGVLIQEWFLPTPGRTYRSHEREGRCRGRLDSIRVIVDRLPARLIACGRNLPLPSLEDSHLSLKTYDLAGATTMTIFELEGIIHCADGRYQTFWVQEDLKWQTYEQKTNVMQEMEGTEELPDGFTVCVVYARVGLW